ncbi:hypothetical protein TI04_12180, partial [Achromatium sp. WMS2]
SYREEGKAIASMYARKLRFELDKLAINGGYFRNVLHLIRDGNQELLQETMDQYTYSVPLNQDAIISGTALSILMIMLVELLFGLVALLIRLMLSSTKKITLQSQVDSVEKTDTVT